MVELQEPKLKVRDERGIRKEIYEIVANEPDEMVQAARVVELAKNPSSAMHSEFNWNIQEAAYQHWLTQARSLIRRIKVVDPSDKTETPMPALISLRSDRKKPGGGYRLTKDVLNNKQLLAELEETAKKDIEALLARYEMLKDLVARVKKAIGSKDTRDDRPKVGARPLPKKG